MNKMIGKYLATTFIVSWLLWGSVVIAGKLGIECMMFGSPIGTMLYVFGGISPAICEIVLKKRNSTKEEFKQFMMSIVNPKHSVWMYVYAIGGAMVIQAIPVLFKLAEVKQPLYIGFIMIIPMIIGGGVEEIGWRGLLQPQLEQKCPHIVAAISVGVIWAIWHLPLWFIDGTNQQSMNFGWFCINTIMLSFFIGSVTYISKSIFMAIIAHASINAFWEIIPASEKMFPSVILMFFVIIVTMVIDYFAGRNEICQKSQKNINRKRES